jgi:hypothetical protein
LPTRLPAVGPVPDIPLFKFRYRLRTWPNFIVGRRRIDRIGDVDEGSRLVDQKSALALVDFVPRGLGQFDGALPICESAAGGMINEHRGHASWAENFVGLLLARSKAGHGREI